MLDEAQVGQSYKHKPCSLLLLAIFTLKGTQNQLESQKSIRESKSSHALPQYFPMELPLHCEKSVP